MLGTSQFDYHLPEELIAQYPAAKRDGSRMMVLDRVSGDFEIRPFGDIVNYIGSGDALIFNDTRVMRSRMYARKNGLPDGAKFEILLTAPLDDSFRRWKALVKPGKRAVPGTTAVLTDSHGNINTDGDGFKVIGRCDEEAFELEFFGREADELQKIYGHIPLPPYIRRGDENADDERYQTIYAKNPGAVAAPTAGLHFTPEILQILRDKGVNEAALTLHVGPGTFKPVSAEDVAKHRMHTEEFFLTGATAELIEKTRHSGHKVLAVGTTTVRVLESCVNPDGTLRPGHGYTDIFLYPPYVPKVPDMLLTNFHLPKSTLLMLVSTFCSREKVLKAYEAAIAAGMRFFSYGDCMLLK